MTGHHLTTSRKGRRLTGCILHKLSGGVAAFFFGGEQEALLLEQGHLPLQDFSGEEPSPIGGSVSASPCDYGGVIQSHQEA